MKIKFNNNVLLLVLEKLKKFTLISGKLGYAISKTKKQMLQELQLLEDEKYKLFEKYGTEDEESHELKIKKDSENYQKFMEQITPLLQIEVEIDVFQLTKEEFEKHEEMFDIPEATVEDFDMLQELFIKKQDKTE